MGTLEDLDEGISLSLLKVDHKIGVVGQSAGFLLIRLVVIFR